jgi:hypothetical protein
VLVLDGEAVLLSLGETESGYMLVSIDEADGVRLSAPDGSEIGLAVPE